MCACVCVSVRMCACLCACPCAYICLLVPALSWPFYVHCLVLSKEQLLDHVHNNICIRAAKYTIIQKQGYTAPVLVWYQSWYLLYCQNNRTPNLI